MSTLLPGPHSMAVAYARQGDRAQARELLALAANCMRQGEQIPKPVAEWLAEALARMADGADPSVAFNLENPPHRPPTAQIGPASRDEVVLAMSNLLILDRIKTSVLQAGRPMRKTTAARIIIEAYRLPFTPRTVVNWFNASPWK
jgi:hypothetical protein